MATAWQPSLAWSIGRLFLGLLVVLPLLYLVARLGAHRFPGRQGRLKVQASTYVAPGKGVHLVQLGERFFLLGTAEKEIKRLAAFTDPELAHTLATEPAPEVITNPFQDMLAAKIASLKSLRTRGQGDKDDTEA